MSDDLPEWVQPIPKDLNEATARIVQAMPVETKEFIREGQDLSHHGFGTFIRNEWELWHDSVLAKWFWDTHKIWMADDMSSIILGNVEAIIRGENFDIDAEVKRYQAHWLKYSNIQPGERPKP